jgi:hypothetical protein
LYCVVPTIEVARLSVKHFVEQRGTTLKSGANVSANSLTSAGRALTANQLTEPRDAASLGNEPFREIGIHHFLKSC